MGNLIAPFRTEHYLVSVKTADAKSTPAYSSDLHILGLIITIAVRSAQIQELLHWGLKICSTISSTMSFVEHILEHINAPL